MSVKTEDVKPDMTVDGHDVFHIPVEEEELEVESSYGNSKIWAMKIPRFLLERWERVREGGVHLGTLVVDNSTQPQRITLKLPVEEAPKASDKGKGKEKDKEKDKDSRPTKRQKLDTEGIPDEYEVVMPSERVKNTYIFSEHKRTWVAQPGEEGSAARRKREKAKPSLVGTLAHEASVRPLRNDQYLKILEQRRLDNEQSKRPIVQLDETNMTQAKLNQLASGFSNASSKLGKGLVMGASAQSGGRSARLERRELHNKLFALFSEKPYWSITALKATLQQPDQYLREVLSDVAILNREGNYKNMYHLKDEWKELGEGGDVKPVKDDESDDEEDEEDSDDDELELVEVD